MLHVQFQKRETCVVCVGVSSELNTTAFMLLEKGLFWTHMSTKLALLGGVLSYVWVAKGS
jgi:hypothetical protein